MKAWNFECVAYDGAIYCVQCLPEGVQEDNEEVSPVFATEEVESYPTCDACGAEHDYMCLIESGNSNASYEAGYAYACGYHD